SFSFFSLPPALVPQAPPSLHLPSPSSVAGACFLLLLPAGACVLLLLPAVLVRPPPPSCSVCWCVLLLLPAVSGASSSSFLQCLIHLLFAYLCLNSLTPTKAATMNWKTINKPCKKLLISSGGASSGRNSAGCITIWHRGGGSKRLHRNVDLKRNTSSVGIVERLEYDPNRSSKIALVRWTEGVQPNKPKERFTPSHNLVPGPITTTIAGNFPLSCMAPNNSRTNTEFVGRSRLGSLKDIFISSLATPGPNNLSSLNIPRIAVAGARPGFFATQMRDEAKDGEEKTFALSDIKKWKKDSIIWAHRSKRKAAVSWQSIGGHEMTLDFVREDEDETTVDQGRLPVDHVTKTKDQRAPVSYILASHELEVGQMVMNCDSSNPSLKQRV
ncbi:hypothetical protein V2J09_003555, partial [Rumex salicifolius]